jgi:aspartyl-tRNA(Asn)/glutamyl-tRNA(Gln) amidotransferase subunit A
MSEFLFETVVANIFGHCAISIPAGFAENGTRRLPIGVQLQSKAFDEATLLRIARMLEAATDHHLQTPDIVGSVTS